MYLVRVVKLLVVWVLVHNLELQVKQVRPLDCLQMDRVAQVVNIHLNKMLLLPK